jgi:TM2 domain-containing membrane protein YozV
MPLSGEPDAGWRGFLLRNGALAASLFDARKAQAHPFFHGGYLGCRLGVSMKIIAMLINLFLLPGVGTLMVGKTGHGITQILLFLLAIVLIFTVIGALIGIPLAIGIWIWGIVSVATANPQPVQVQIVDNRDLTPR